MNTESKERKKFSLHRFFISFKYSYDGLKYAYLNEQSMLLHLMCTIVVIVLGIFLKISLIEWIICITLLTCIMSIELLNTAIEATVDLVTKEKKELAKIAKDTSSASAGIISIFSLVVFLLIFVPKIIEFIGW